MMTSNIMALASCMIVAVAAASGLVKTTADEWGPWQPVPDGHLNAVEIAFKRGKFPYGKGQYQFYYKLRNGYDQPVVVDVEIRGIGDKHSSTAMAKLLPSQEKKNGGWWLVTTGIESFHVRRIGVGTNDSAIHSKDNWTGGLGISSSGKHYPPKKITNGS